MAFHDFLLASQKLGNHNVQMMVVELVLATFVVSLRILLAIKNGAVIP